MWPPWVGGVVWPEQPPAQGGHIGPPLRNFHPLLGAACGMRVSPGQVWGGWEREAAFYSSDSSSRRLASYSSREMRPSSSSALSWRIRSAPEGAAGAGAGKRPAERYCSAAARMVFRSWRGWEMLRNTEIPASLAVSISTSP